MPRARELPETQQVYVTDREADIMALLVRARDLDHAADYLIRCQRMHDGEPGAKTLWLGLRNVAVSVVVMQAMRDG